MTTSELIVGTILFIMIILFIDKRMDQKYELKLSKSFSEQKNSNIEAQAKYKKASKKKNSTLLSDFLSQISKMLFTLF